MCNCYGNKTVGFEDKAFDNSSSNTTDDLQGETHNRFLPPNVVYLFNIQDNPRPQNDIDILEQNIREKSPYLLKLLLQDKTTGRYIRWACDGYAQYGSLYTAEKEILPELITGENTKIIQPRTAKSKEEQQNRTRKSAEVFTPSWICNDMNNLCDDEWLGYTNAFNTKQEHYWLTNLEKINFSGKKTWQKYVDSKRLEITCGEAPFLTSRYDTTTGEVLVVNQRIGIIDRKLRVICENTDNEADWFKWAKRAYEATYGYEFQGDNLLLARENLLYTFIDFYKHHFGKQPNLNQIKQIANILAWNIWQMDGLKECAPFDTADEAQYELFDNLPTLNFPINCRIKNWRTKQVFNFRDLKGDKTMKFDFVIGNPPYQENIENRGEQPPVYHMFYDTAMNISDKVMLITPARFLFDVGKTPSEWNHKMLNDKHFGVLAYFANSQDVFSSVDIKGGVAISYKDKSKVLGPIDVFIPIKEVNSIVKKVIPTISESLANILYSNTSYKYDLSFFREHPELKERVSGGSVRYLSSSVFDKFPEVFYKSRPDDGDEYAEIIGRQNNKRISYYFKTKYLNPPENFVCYKVFIPSSNGSGALGEVLTTPLMGEPLMGHTETFISFGKFDNIIEASNLNKYVKTKFARIMLGSKKVTQGNKTPKIWSNVPLQDFTNNSDIDWSKSIPEIDKQLYAKYGLSEEEINFIEQNVKPME